MAGLALHHCVLHPCSTKRTAVLRAGGDSANATAQRRLPTSSLDIVNEDLQFLQQHAGKDWDTLKDAHDLVAAYLNPVVGEQREQEAEEQVQVLQTTLQAAHDQVHSSEELLGESVMRLSELERSAAQFRFTAEGPQPQPSSSSSSAPPSPAQSRTAHAASATPTHPPAPQQQQQQPHTAQQPGEPRKLGADTGLPANLQNFWFPAEFSSRLPAGGIVPLELFHQRWVLFRDSAGRASCLRDTCAHRACPLSLGQVVDGAIQCPYHGWTYDGQGRCTGMPSTQFRPGVHVDALPVSEAGGFVWLWPGSEPPSDLECQAVQPPPGFQVHAELQLEVPVDHGLLVENLLDLAHAPFTHTTTFAKGWPVPDVVKFQAQQLLAGHWEPYPIDMSFEPPCMVLSTIGLAQPGKIMRGVRASHCQNHLHQLHVCLPSGPGRTRLLYRMSMDFLAWTRHIPLIQNFWSHIAGQVLGEDLVLVKGQQERMGQGADVWANPVAYDKLGVRYRRWRNSLVLPKNAPARREAEEELVQTMSAGALFATQETTDIHTEGKAQA